MNLKSSKSFPLAAIMLAVYLTLLIGAGTINVLAQDDSAKKARTIELIAAAGYNQINEVKRMLDAGYDVNGKYAGGTALHAAIVDGRVELVKLLLQYDADPSITDDNNTVPGYASLNALQLAEKFGRREIIDLIKQAVGSKNGADISVQKTAETSTIPANTVNTPKPNPSRSNAGISDLYSPSWEKSGRFKVGEIVLYSRDRGKTWQRGTITKITTLDSVPRLKDILFYQIDDLRKVTTDIVDTAFVTTLERQNYWTEFFVGDWNLTLPMAVTERVQGNDVYRVYSGADRLPPLRVNADGSYLWAIDKNKVIRGTWKANENGPGLVFLKGDRGENWNLYSTSEASERESFKTDTVRLVSESGNYTPNHGFRIQKK